jgi:acetyl esterase/lipase
MTESDYRYPCTMSRFPYLTAVALSRLPARLQLWLAREEPLVIDGRTFDPAAQLLRKLRPRKYGLLEPTIERGRQRYRYETSAFRGPATKVDSVRDFDIGSLRARRYQWRDARDTTLYFHGGGFTIGDLDTHDEPCRILCHHGGVNVISVGYRLAPEHPFPAAVDDAMACLRWALNNADRVSVGGDSAGANLATVACREVPGALAQLLIYPPTDFVERRRRSYALYAEGFAITARDALAMGRAYRGDASPNDPRLSPLRADLAGMPPAFIVTAGFDMLRDEGEEYAAALRRAGVEVRSQEVSSLGHGFIHTTGVVPAARAAMMAIARDWRGFLDRV